MYVNSCVFVLFCYVLCYCAASSRIYSYQLPESDKSKSLNVTINHESYQQFKISVECYNYDSLKFLEVRLRESKEFELYNGVLLYFKKCFNNATDNENYNYGLARWFNSLPHFNTTYHFGYPITIQLEEYATVNSDALFENFDFNKFDTVTFINLGFKSTKFLNNLYCQHCVFENSGIIDFNDFNSDTLDKTNTIQISFTKLINLNQDNLKKFKHITNLYIRDFDLDDTNVFNVPNLFEHNVNLTEINVQRSNGKLMLHDQVFRGTKNLQTITLQGLHLDTLPKDLFKDMESLHSLNFASNNIKSIDPSMFQTNIQLGFLSFENNPFYTEPHDKLEGILLPSSSSYLELSNFTAHTFDLLEQLIKTENVSRVSFQSFAIDKFNFTDFLNLNHQRPQALNVDFRSGEPALDWEYIKSVENIIQSQNNISGDLNVIIRLGFSGDALCHDCTMIKQLFPHFIKRYNNPPGFYIDGSGIFVEIILPESCNHLEENFEKLFEENCPTNCICKFNSILDNVKIDCTNKNFTEIPLIPYPAQYDKLVSLNLNFENNSISVFSMKNQDANVLKKLSTLNFKNNKIGTLQFDESDLLINNVSLDLCDNPIIETIEGVLEIKLATESKYLSRYNCFTDNEFERVANYIHGHKTTEEIDEYLNDLKCK